MLFAAPHVAILVETSKAFGRGALRGITKYVRAHGPWSVYIDERGLHDGPPPWLARWRGSGLIVRGGRDVVRAARNSKAPLVHLGEEDFGLPTVYPADEAIAEFAAEHLLQRQFRAFAFAGLRGMRWSDARQAAFHRRIRAAGFACHVYERSHLASDGYLSASVRARGVANERRKRSYSWESEQDGLAAWLSALPKPVGIMACYDVMGLRVLDACRRSQIAIPEQVAVIGVDNDELLCDLADPPLTSIAHDIEAIGYEAASLLDRMMRGEKPPDRPTMLAPRGIVLRKSTDIVAVEDKFVARALSFIRQRACNGITVAQVAGHVGMRRRSLERRFQVSLSRTPGEEIARVRLEHIKTLLTETDFTLEAIAHKTGFKDASSVSVFFANQTGQAPGRYRNSVARVANARPQAPGFRAGP